MKFSLSNYLGPSTLVTAAFIGPGTVTVCTLAGVNTGYSLLWALVFSVIATIFLQEMTARLGLVTQQGFGEAIRAQIQNPALRVLSVLLVLGAIVVGNAAYEGGNISGAVLGFEELFTTLDIGINGVKFSLIPPILGIIAFGLLMIGRIKIIERFLIGLVMILSLVFVTTAIVVQPDISSILKGMFLPSTNAADLLLVVGLIGTTVVPYNLFLHAALVREKYHSVEQLSDLRKENATAIILGGIISMSIVITSATTMFGNAGISNAADMATQLRPLLGNWAGYFLGTGLFAAGISSAITAPLAAAYAAKGILGWQGDLNSMKFRAVWMSILLIGVVTSMFGIKPVVIIQFAQVANGILLPVVVVFLIYLMNKTALLKTHTNSMLQNIVGAFILLVTIALAVRSFNSVFDFL